MPLLVLSGARGHREDGDRQLEPLQQLVDEPLLLPVGAVGRPQRDQDVVRRRAGKRIRKREHGIVGANGSARFGSQLLNLTENRLESLVGLLARFVGGGRQPFEARWKSGGDDEDLVGCLDQFTDTEWQLVRGYLQPLPPPPRVASA